jgi:hypothetical protein
MMIVVAVIAVAAWLSATAVLVARDPNAEQMSHLRQRRDTGELVVQTHLITGTFCARYWRRLLGRPWPGTYVCPSCRERYKRRDGRPLTDLDASDDGTKMLNQMSRINHQRQEAEIKTLIERTRRKGR